MNKVFEYLNKLNILLKLQNKSIFNIKNNDYYLYVLKDCKNVLYGIQNNDYHYVYYNGINNLKYLYIFFNHNMNIKQKNYIDKLNNYIFYDDYISIYDTNVINKLTITNINYKTLINIIDNMIKLENIKE